MKFLKLLKETTTAIQKPELLEMISNKLFNLYSFPIRKYHDISHIDSCIDEFNCMPKTLYKRKEEIKILFTLYYHDCFYDPKCHNNEVISSQIAYVDLIALGFIKEFAEEIRHLILLTKHESSSDKLVEQTVMDIDLAILGKELPVFFNYEADIRTEYDFVSKQDYLTGRSHVLQRFLDRDSIYQTSYFKDLYEKKARENIKTLLEILNTSI